MSAIAVVTAADTAISLLLDALAAAQKFSGIIASAAAAGRPVSLEDLKAARAEDDVASAQLDAAISAHAGPAA